MSTPAPAFIPRESLSAYQRWELASLAPASGAAAAGNGDAAARAAERMDAETQAREGAYAEGLAAGHRDGLARAAIDVERLHALLATLGAAVGDREQVLADAVLDLALALARKLAGEALAVRRELLLPVIGDALAQLPELGQRVRLHLDPADVELVRTLMAAFPALEGCQLVPDAAIGAGGFRVETEQCEVDATLATRWQRLAASLGRSYEWLDHT